jgi:hypothetical protein
MINLDQFTQEELKDLQKQIKLKLDDLSCRGYGISFDIIFDKQYHNTEYAQQQVTQCITELVHNLNAKFKENVLKSFDVSVLNENHVKSIYRSTSITEINIPKIYF